MVEGVASPPLRHTTAAEIITPTIGTITVLHPNHVGTAVTDVDDLPSESIHETAAIHMIAMTVAVRHLAIIVTTIADHHDLALGTDEEEASLVVHRDHLTELDLTDTAVEVPQTGDAARAAKWDTSVRERRDQRDTETRNTTNFGRYFRV